jgi:uncharacterized protein
MQDQVVLITGAGGGFGQELTQQLLHAGAYLILTSRNSAKLHASAVRAAHAPGISARKGRILGLIQADLASDAGCAQLAERCTAITPQIDIVIHNAGMGLYGPINAIPALEREQLIQLNLLAPMRLTAHLLPAMIARGSGQIVLVSSILGLAGLPGLSVYAAAKFGLRGFGEALASDVRPHGVAVTLVYPFFARTEILDAAQYGRDAHQRVPGWLLDDPAEVVRQTIQGMRARRLHVYPGLRARAFALASRVAPGVLPVISRLVTGR